jgi:hypothetical protein
MPPLTEYDPTRMPNDPWFQQFHDPLRAYSNLPALVRYFSTTPTATPAPTSADFVQYAWQVAQAHPVADANPSPPGTAGWYNDRPDLDLLCPEGLKDALAIAEDAFANDEEEMK